MYTIGQIAKRFSISRSTLLYYDSIGILRPTRRSGSNYRLYCEDDIERMGRISLFRKAGLSLASISSLLDQQDDNLSLPLERRLSAINGEIQALRDQQKVILKILESDHPRRRSRVITKEIWVSLLASAGLDEDGMRAWHIEFEQTAPEAHQDFLESIGVESQEITVIREWARSGRS